MAYRTTLFKAEAREQRRQDKLSKRIHKALQGGLKPSDAEIIKEQRRRVNEMYFGSMPGRI